MAQYEQKDNSGALFKNEKKSSPNQPDYNGNCKVNGKEMRMAAWLKESNGKKYMSFSFSEPYVAESMSLQEKQRSKLDTSSFDDLESNLPF